MPRPDLVCGHCDTHVPWGATVCRGCGAEARYGPTIHQRRRAASFGCVLGGVIGSVLFIAVGALLHGLFNFDLNQPWWTYTGLVLLSICAVIFTNRSLARARAAKADQVTFVRLYDR